MFTPRWSHKLIEQAYPVWNQKHHCWLNFNYSLQYQTPILYYICFNFGCHNSVEIYVLDFKFHFHVLPVLRQTTKNFRSKVWIFVLLNQQVYGRASPSPPNLRWQTYTLCNHNTTDSLRIIFFNIGGQSTEVYHKVWIICLINMSRNWKEWTTTLSYIAAIYLCLIQNKMEVVWVKCAGR